MISTSQQERDTTKNKYSTITYNTKNKSLKHKIIVLFIKYSVKEHNSKKSTFNLLTCHPNRICILKCF